MSPPPFSREDEERMVRLITRVVQEELKSRDQRLDHHSGQYRQIIPTVARELMPTLNQRISDTQHTVEDHRLAFERFMMETVGHVVETVGRVESKVDATAASIPPASLAAKGAEAAAVAGANASLKTEGRTAAIQVAADRADSSALDAKRWAKLGPVIVLVVQGLVLGIYHAAQALLHSGGSP